MRPHLPISHPRNQPQSPFDTNNYDSIWAVTGDLAGSIQNAEGALKIKLTRSILARGSAFHTPTEVVSMFAEIRRPTTHSWSTGRKSEEHPIAQRLGRNEQIKVEPFDLTIPSPGSNSSHWTPWYLECVSKIPAPILSDSCTFTSTSPCPERLPRHPTPISASPRSP